MSDGNLKWKDERIGDLKKSLAFFSNKEKLKREKWVVRRLLNSLKVEFSEDEMTEAEEPTDVSFQDARFQVKEIPDKGRRRTDEYKAKLEKAKQAQKRSDLLVPYAPKDIAFTDVVQRCHAYAETLESEFKYGRLEQKDLDLLIYFNWHEHNIIPPSEVQVRVLSFRSLSVVSNHYCVIVYAEEHAPFFLKANVGKVTEYLEI